LLSCGKFNMGLSPKKINTFLLFKLPLAYIAGVRVLSIKRNEVVVRIKHRWINQNPFKSMFWAAQGMAAELSTGILVMQAIEQSKERVSMLVTQQQANFYKKATGKIIFSSTSNMNLKALIIDSKEKEEGKSFQLISEGKDERGVIVSKFFFEWSVKVKSR